MSKLLITQNKEVLHFNQVISIIVTKKKTGYYIVAHTAVYNYDLINTEFNNESTAQSFLLNNVLHHLQPNDNTLVDFRKLKV